MTYGEGLAYLDSLAQFGWKLDLARIERLCELIGHPEQRFPAILVGGSAGKGSTCTQIASILTAAGQRVGTAPKPHLVTHRERVQVGDELITEDDFARLMTEIVPLIQQVTREEGSPTVFEAMTLLAFMRFAECAGHGRLDRAVVEVGLGGRFDATNVLAPEVAVITMIGLDHTDRLGTTVEEIAFEKAGIIKPSAKVVTGATGAALQVIESAARERGAKLRRLGEEVRIANVRLARGATRFDLTLEAESGTCHFQDLVLGMEGEHQARNAALAVAATLWLGPEDGQPDESAVRAGLARAHMPGRMQVIQTEPLVLLDGAHSPDRAAALATAVRELYLGDRSRLALVIGCSAGHEPATVVEHLAPLAGYVIASQSGHPAAIPAAEIAAAAIAAGIMEESVETIQPVELAVARAIELATEHGMVLVTGSLFVVGEVLALRGGAR